MGANWPGVPQEGENIRRALVTAMLLGSAASAVAFIFLRIAGTGRLQLMLTFYLYSVVALMAAGIGYRYADLEEPGSFGTTFQDMVPFHRLHDWFRPDYTASVNGRRLRVTDPYICEKTVSFWIKEGRRSCGITYPRDDLVFLRPRG